jgi:hypothetical protein
MVLSLCARPPNLAYTDFAQRRCSRSRTFTFSRNSLVIRCTRTCHGRKPSRFSTAMIRRYPNRGCSRRVLRFELLQPLCFAHLHADGLATPFVKRGFADPVLPVFGPASLCFKIPVICSSLNLPFFTPSSSFLDLHRSAKLQLRVAQFHRARSPA